MNNKVFIVFLITVILSNYAYQSHINEKIKKTQDCLAMIYNAQNNYRDSNEKYADSIDKLNLQFPKYCEGITFSVSSDKFQFSVIASETSSGKWETNHRKQIIQRF